MGNKPMGALQGSVGPRPVVRGSVCLAMPSWLWTAQSGGVRSWHFFVPLHWMASLAQKTSTGTCVLWCRHGQARGWLPWVGCGRVGDGRLPLPPKHFLVFFIFFLCWGKSDAPPSVRRDLLASTVESDPWALYLEFYGAVQMIEQW